MAEERPLPPLHEDELPFWEGARRGELLLPRCGDCQHTWWPPGPVCPQCLSDRVEWRRASGRGVVASWVVFHRRLVPGFEPPYNVAWVQLEEGPRLVANLVDVPLAEIRTGMPVEAVFQRLTDEVTLVQFRPRRQSS